MTTLQKEQLREVLIDYLQILTSTVGQPTDRKIAQVRLLLKEVA